MDYFSHLSLAIRDLSARVSIVGIGYVGLPLALACARSGFHVSCIDLDNRKVEAINSGSSFISHIDSGDLRTYVAKGAMKAYSDFSVIAESDIIVLCLPTPLGAHKEPDLTYITRALTSIDPFVRAGQMICLESTTYPGTTEEIVIPWAEQHGFALGSNYFVVYSPEREDPGNRNFTTQNIPKLVSGDTKHCLSAGLAFYGKVVKTVVAVSNTKTAEMAKVLENVHRSVNIGLVNEMKLLAHKMDIDIHEVISAAASKPFGFVPYYPGPGLGGHCIPIDPFYLSWKAKEYGLSSRFIELSGEINSAMPSYVVKVCTDALNTRGLPIKHTKVLILGAAYKKDIDDIRESPAISIANAISSHGGDVSIYDPYVSRVSIESHMPKVLILQQLDYEQLDSYQLVVICTDHSCIDYDSVARFSSLIVDSRGALPRSDKVFHA
jgi:UDP-N-acetyl-D-glucosamine dehydrogenase